MGPTLRRSGRWFRFNPIKVQQELVYSPRKNPMKTIIASLAFAAGLLFSAAGLAQTPAPAGAPSGATGLCKDGTYYTGASKKGACHGHKGVKTWYGPAASAAAPAGKTMPAPAASAAPGGGHGMVWVNSSTKVYHCQGDRWYGKTKTGSYMSEADAKAKGFRASAGKTCGA
jgi:hypothetical protein